MFPLRLQELPQNAVDLSVALDRSIAEFIASSVQPVRIEDDAFPSLRFVGVNLDGAVLRPRSLHPTIPTGTVAPAFTIGRAEMSGRAIQLGGLSCDFSLTAARVELNQGRDAGGGIVLLIQNAESGEINISAARKDLETIVAQLARTEAARHGVQIESAKLQVQSRRDRSLNLEIEFRVKKLFLSAVIRIRGQLDIDDSLTAKISGLACEGDGALGSLASSALTPQLQRYEGRQIELMALPLGEIHLRDVRIAAGETIAVRAHFGAVA